MYCKFLLSFETLSDEERQKIEHAIQTDRQKQEKHRTSCCAEECIEKVMGNNNLKSLGNTSIRCQRMSTVITLSIGTDRPLQTV